MDFLELKPLFTKIFDQIESANAVSQKLREENEKLREELIKYQMLFSELSSQSELPIQSDINTKNVIVELPIPKNKEIITEPKKRGRKPKILTDEEKKTRKAEYNRRYRESQKN